MGVLGDVRQQLADGGDDQVVVPGALGARADVNGRLKSGSVPGVLGEAVQNGFEPRLLEPQRVQGEDLMAQLAIGLIEGRAGSLLRARHAANDVGELLAGEQDVLDGVVVQRLGQPALLVGLGVERLLDELATHLGELDDGTLTASDHRGEHHRGTGHPQQRETVLEQGPEVLRQDRVGMREGDGEVGDDRQRRPACRQLRREPQGGGDRKDVEGEPQRRVLAAGGVDEERHGAQIDQSGDDREAGRSRTDEGDQQRPGGVDAERHDQPREQVRAQVRVAGLREQRDRHERQAQNGDPANLVRLAGPGCAGPPQSHSSRPRRIASATQAARSETPSFS